MTDGGEYVLRPRDRAEVERLAHQHDVWAGPTHWAVERAGVEPGDAVADLGCGPGFLAVELARRVGPEGTVVGIDSSSLFVDHLQARAREEGLSWVAGRRGDIREAWAEPDTLDVVFCRWVLMFLPDPEQAILRAAEALRPGGRFVAMEYAQFGSMSLYPRGAAFARTYRAVHRLLADAGGDPDVGSRVPRLAEVAGLDVVEIHPTLRVGRPGDPVWEWLESTHPNHTNLVEKGLLSEQELAEHLREWDEATARPGAFFTAPPLLTVVAQKAPVH